MGTPGHRHTGKAAMWRQAETTAMPLQTQEPQGLPRATRC